MDKQLLITKFQELLDGHKMGQEKCEELYEKAYKNRDVILYTAKFHQVKKETWQTAIDIINTIYPD